ncbi:HNH endonuclease [Chloroflexota bacterium]
MPISNPDWTRDELILALELYFRVSPSSTNKNHPEIVKLSNLLQSLPIHPELSRGNEFRNPAGIYMKLGNFLRFDPSYSGKGLLAGSKLDKVVWDEFASDKTRLIKVANAIRNGSPTLLPPQSKNEDTEIINEDEEFPEGRILTRLHRQRERNQTAIRKKKKLVLDTFGKLECEVCKFDFADYYGDIGIGFAECHHNKPVSELAKGSKTKFSDLSIICANCHRVIHKMRPWLSVLELRILLIQRGRVLE